MLPASGRSHFHALSLHFLTHSLISVVACPLRHAFPSSLCSLSSSWHPDSRQWFMLVIMGKNMLLFNRCEICVAQRVWPHQRSLVLSLSDSPWASHCFTSLNPFSPQTRHTALCFLSNHPPFFFFFSSRRSYLFSASGQNNSQLTPISSPSLPRPFLLSSVHHSRPPQDENKILSLPSTRF